MKQRLISYFLILLSCFSWGLSSALADGVVVDKVYHPYVLPNEQEVEWRVISRQTDAGNLLTQRIGYGHSVSEYLTLEGYLIGSREEDRNGESYGGDFALEAYEFEARLMLTDQGEYWADWGALFEFEKEHNEDNYEITSGLLVEKEFEKTSLTLNFFLVYEWGATIDQEWETEFRAKYRYRWIPQIQPSIELYSGEDYLGVGPAFMGIQRFDGQKQLKWEAGFISEFSNSGKDHTFRFALEYEF